MKGRQLFSSFIYRRKRMETSAKDIDFKKVQNIIKEELKQFVALKVWMENQKEVKEADGLFFRS